MNSPNTLIYRPLQAIVKPNLSWKMEQYLEYALLELNDNKEKQNLQTITPNGIITSVLGNAIECGDINLVENLQLGGADPNYPIFHTPVMSLALSRCNSYNTSGDTDGNNSNNNTATAILSSNLTLETNIDKLQSSSIVEKEEYNELIRYQQEETLLQLGKDPKILLNTHKNVRSTAGQIQVTILAEAVVNMVGFVNKNKVAESMASIENQKILKNQIYQMSCNIYILVSTVRYISTQKEMFTNVKIDMWKSIKEQCKQRQGWYSRKWKNLLLLNSFRVGSSNVSTFATNTTATTTTTIDATDATATIPTNTTNNNISNKKKNKKWWQIDKSKNDKKIQINKDNTNTNANTTRNIIKKTEEINQKKMKETNRYGKLGQEKNIKNQQESSSIEDQVKIQYDYGGNFQHCSGGECLYTYIQRCIRPNGEPQQNSKQQFDKDIPKEQYNNKKIEQYEQQYSLQNRANTENIFLESELLKIIQDTIKEMKQQLNMRFGIELITPLHLAVSIEWLGIDTLEKLLYHGCIPDIVDRYYITSVLTSTLDYTRKQHPSVIPHPGYEERFLYYIHKLCKDKQKQLYYHGLSLPYGQNIMCDIPYDNILQNIERLVHEVQSSSILTNLEINEINYTKSFLGQPVFQHDLTIEQYDAFIKEREDDINNNKYISKLSSISPPIKTRTTTGKIISSLDWDTYWLNINKDDIKKKDISLRTEFATNPERVRRILRTMLGKKYRTQTYTMERDEQLEYIWNQRQWDLSNTKLFDNGIKCMLEAENSVRQSLKEFCKYRTCRDMYNSYRINSNTNEYGQQPIFTSIQTYSIYKEKVAKHIGLQTPQHAQAEITFTPQEKIYLNKDILYIQKNINNNDDISKPLLLQLFMYMQYIGGFKINTIGGREENAMFSLARNEDPYNGIILKLSPQLVKKYINMYDINKMNETISDAAIFNLHSTAAVQQQKVYNVPQNRSLQPQYSTFLRDFSVYMGVPKGSSLSQVFGSEQCGGADEGITEDISKRVST